MSYTPHFQNHEVLVKPLHAEIKLSEEDMAEENVGVVAYVGKECEKYEVGDKVLFSKKISKKTTFFEEELWGHSHEKMVVCKLK